MADFTLVADMVHWVYDENGDITMRLEPLPLAPYNRVVEGTPYLESQGTYRTLPVIGSDQYPSIRTNISLGVRR